VVANSVPPFWFWIFQFWILDFGFWIGGECVRGPLTPGPSPARGEGRNTWRDFWILDFGLGSERAGRALLIRLDRRGYSHAYTGQLQGREDVRNSLRRICRRSGPTQRTPRKTEKLLSADFAEDADFEIQIGDIGVICGSPWPFYGPRLANFRTHAHAEPLQGRECVREFVGADLRA
jgi:hypothetical protein